MPNKLHEYVLWCKTHSLKRQLLYVQIGVVSLRQCECVLTTYVTENKENYFDFVHIVWALKGLTYITCLHQTQHNGHLSPK